MNSSQQKPELEMELSRNDLWRILLSNGIERLTGIWETTGLSRMLYFQLGLKGKVTVQNENFLNVQAENGLLAYPAVSVCYPSRKKKKK